MKTITPQEFSELQIGLSEVFSTEQERDAFDAKFTDAEKWVKENWTDTDFIELNEIINESIDSSLDRDEEIALLRTEIERIKDTMPLTESILNSNAITHQAAQNLGLEKLLQD